MAGGSDLAHITRLKEEEERALHETKEKLQHWQKFEDDYTALHTRLSTLPDKVSHQIMVPFGNLAFMPGQLIHTNEIMVLLGDNWFAERSAKQACEIINRRKVYVKQMKEDLQKQQYLLESRLGFVSDMKETAEGRGDLVEIREEYDAAKEANWREERSTRKREAVAKSATSTSSLSQGSDANDETETRELTGEELLWARLDELERQEEELDELEMSEEEDEGGTPGERTGVRGPTDTELHPTLPGERKADRKHVHWEEDDKSSPSCLPLHLHQKDEEDGYHGDGDSDDEDSGEESTSTSVINFSHTRVPYEEHKEDGKDLSPRSPGEIYDLYHAMNRGTGDSCVADGQLKSILKQPVAKPSSDAQHSVEKEEKRPPLPAPASAFTGSVVEHSRSEIAPPTSTPPTEHVQEPKRVSKFKAARQGRR